MSPNLHQVVSEEAQQADPHLREPNLEEISQDAHHKADGLPSSIPNTLNLDTKTTTDPGGSSPEHSVYIEDQGCAIFGLISGRLFASEALPNWNQSERIL